MIFFVYQLDNAALRLESFVIILQPRGELVLHKAVIEVNTKATHGAGTGTQAHPLATKH